MAASHCSNALVINPLQSVKIACSVALGNYVPKHFSSNVDLNNVLLISAIILARGVSKPKVHYIDDSLAVRRNPGESLWSSVMRDLPKAGVRFDRDLAILNPDILTLNSSCLENEKENRDSAKEHGEFHWRGSYHSRSVICHRPLRPTVERSADTKLSALMT
jgi:hypothetical protein